MASVVEARSLASLTTLASDPPIYPRNPTQAPHPALTLYIVRVPGSRDVFMTPLKPREKVVSAEDVQSSLYFLHIDSPDDRLVEPSESIISDDISTSENIARKPLPTPPVSPSEGSPRQRSPAFDAHLRVPQRKPVSSASLSRQSLNLPEIPLRPSVNSHTSQNSESGKSAHSDSRSSFSRRPLSNQFLDPRAVAAHHAASESRGSFELAPTAQEDGPCASLTLIRRDPSSGYQWNVAKIRDPPVHEVSSTLSGDRSGQTKKSGAPLFLEIHNPGYSKFLDFDRTRTVSTSGADLASNLSNQDSTFRRRLWMDGSRFADHSYGHRQTSSQNGHEQIPHSHVQTNRQSLQAMPKAMVDRRSKGYTFQSPWGGRCEFSTGTAGRSLKCKHILENPSSAVMEVSELRFNLPTSGTSRSPLATGSGAKRSSFPGFHRHSTSDELSLANGRVDMANFLDEHGNIDLSLGQERAGGGFQGKQAKLGKLIIEDEGVKMLDLIVAANMALWWRAYERKH